MNLSHHRNPAPGAPHNRPPDVIAHTVKGEFKVLRLTPQYPGGPEHVVCVERDVVAHFFERDDTYEYCEFKNGKL